MILGNFAKRRGELDSANRLSFADPLPVTLIYKKKAVEILVRRRENEFLQIV